MFKPVHGIKGSLALPLTDFAVQMYLDDKTYCTLASMLSGFDYTYLMIKTTNTYEVVKVTGFSQNAINIDRAQDGTTALAFPMNSAVEFVLGTQALAEIINQKMLGQVTLTGGGIVTVTKTGTNAYDISAPEISIVSESDKILVGGEYPNFVISTPVIGDCCG